MSDLLTRLESAQAFKDGTPFQTAALDKVLRDCVAALEHVHKLSLLGTNEISIQVSRICNEHLAALARELESK